MSAENRRPIKARSLTSIRALASWLAKTRITPNQISLWSIAFAALVPVAFGCFSAGTWLASILAIAGIQFRLLCNLIDGMVAVEGGKKSYLGDIYNEFPDRVADTVILVGVSLAQPTDHYLLLSALTAALMAVMTAYTRVLGGAIGTKQYFLGPMAKQHRMALLTAVFAIQPLVKSWISPSDLLIIAMVIISLGCVVTVARRMRRIAMELKAKSLGEESIELDPFPS
jgi:phosphatidylglycerophosphate synthase